MIAPRSMVGQLALLMGLALLVAQLANLALILNERQKLSLARTDGPAIARFVSVAADYTTAAPESRSALLTGHSTRGARFSASQAASIALRRRTPELEERLESELEEAGLKVGEVRAVRDPPASTDARGRASPRHLRLSVQVADGSWLEGSIAAPPPDPVLPARLLAGTALLYTIVLGLTVAMALWLSRPLRELTASAEAFAGRSGGSEVKPRGPPDVRRLIGAFNLMNRRVVALLDEKDRMLGAIGHDLRTPLTSLRIRAESIEPAEERERFIATLDETTAMLEDILVLARTGRPREPVRPVELSALLDTLVEEYRELGRPVELARVEPVVAPVQINLLRRAIRNLLDNAVSYGGSAVVALERGAGEARISVSDEGPGLSEGELVRVLEPFERGESSRSRETGGSGLGLAIVKAVAEAHGGTLALANRKGGGLIAVMQVPIPDAPPPERNAKAQSPGRGHSRAPR